MRFELTDDQALLVATAKEFVARECPPEKVRQHARHGTFDEKTWAKFAANGWLGLGLPEEAGGSGGTLLDAVLLLEATSAAEEAIGLPFGTMCFGGHMLASIGSERQRAEVLPRLLDGSIRFALSITEPGGGTDVLGAMRTTARRTDRGWVINGQKMYTTGAALADYLVVVARTSPPDGRRQAAGVSLFLVDANAPGVSKTPIEVTNDDSTSQVFYDGVEVDEDAVIGEVGRGFYGILPVLNYERIGTAAMCLAWGQGALDEVLAHAGTREAFGGVIGRFQSVQHHIARMHLLLQQARLMVYRAAWLQSEGRESGIDATAAKAVAAENSFAACDAGMQVLGGFGYTKDSDLNRFWRKTRLYRLAPVSNEMALNQVAESLGMPRSY